MDAAEAILQGMHERSATWRTGVAMRQAAVADQGEAALGLGEALSKIPNMLSEKRDTDEQAQVDHAFSGEMLRSGDPMKAVDAALGVPVTMHGAAAKQASLAARRAAMQHDQLAVQDEQYAQAQRKAGDAALRRSFAPVSDPGANRMARLGLDMAGAMGAIPAGAAEPMARGASMRPPTGEEQMQRFGAQPGVGLDTLHRFSQAVSPWVGSETRRTLGEAGLDLKAAMERRLQAAEDKRLSDEEKATTAQRNRIALQDHQAGLVEARDLRQGAVKLTAQQRREAVQAARWTETDARDALRQKTLDAHEAFAQRHMSIMEDVATGRESREDAMAEIGAEKAALDESVKLLSLDLKAGGSGDALIEDVASYKAALDAGLAKLKALKPAAGDGAASGGLTDAQKAQQILDALGK